MTFADRLTGEPVAYAYECHDAARAADIVRESLECAAAALYVLVGVETS
jgi:hypothetical protein